MAKGRASEERNLDEQLAEFTDRVIAGQVSSPSASEDLGNLGNLQEIILEIHHSISHTTPDQNLVGRVQRNLLNVWHQEKEKSISSKNLFSSIKRFLSPQHTGWQSTTQRHRRLISQIALAAIIVLVFLIPLTQSQGTLPGAAAGGTNTAIIIVLLAIGSLTAWYLWTRKK